MEEQEVKPTPAAEPTAQSDDKDVTLLDPQTATPAP